MQQFRLTTWPLDRLPPHPIVVAPAWRDGDLIRFEQGWEPETFKELPDEWALRELPLVNLADADAVTAIVRRYGVIERPFRLMDPLVRPRRRIPRAEGESIWVDDAADYLRVARAAVGHWRACLDGDDVATPWQAEGFPINDEQTAYDILRRAMNEGLRAFAPRLEISYEFRNPLPGMDASSIQGRPTPGLFEGLVLQIFNLISDELPARECANPTCGRLFIRQQGRSTQEQRRSVGVKFCSKSCANSSAQRDYRQRRKAGADSAAPREA